MFYITVISFVYRIFAIVTIVAVNFYSQRALSNIIGNLYRILSQLPKFEVDKSLLLMLSAKLLNYVCKLSMHLSMVVKTTDKEKILLIIMRCSEKFIECTVLDVSLIGYILALLLVKRIIQVVNEHLLKIIADFQNVPQKSGMRRFSLIQIKLALTPTIKIQKDLFKVASRFHEILKVQVLLSALFSFFHCFSFCYFFYYAMAAVNRSFYKQNWGASTKILAIIIFRFVDLLTLAKVAEDTTEEYERAKEVLFRIFPMMGDDGNLDEIVFLVTM